VLNFDSFSIHNIAGYTLRSNKINDISKRHLYMTSLDWKMAGGSSGMD